MSEITRATIRRAARTTEYFIVGQIARKIPPSDRFFLLFELDPLKNKKHDPRVERARKKHERGGYCIDTCILAIVTRAQVQSVVASPEWSEAHLGQDERLSSNQARCVVLADDDRAPQIVVLTARAVNRPSKENEEEDDGTTSH
ncbi:MAG TPA: hypothetical protein VGI39_11225 [Polyangiaceae bacterium]|jgi:hypothetical protein